MIVEQRCHQRTAGLVHIPGAGVDVRQERITQQVVLDEDFLCFLTISPRRMITGMIHTEEDGYRREHSHLHPAQIEVGIVGRILLESTHTVAPIADTRESYINTAADDRFKPLPLRAPVASPDERITLNTCIALACVVEATLSVELGKVLIRCLGIGYREEVVGSLLLDVWIVVVQSASHISLEELDSQVGHFLGSILPPPVHSLVVEEVDDGVGSTVLNGESLLLCCGEQIVALAVVDQRTNVQTKHCHMILIGMVDHALGVFKLILELESTASVAQLGKEAPGRVEPHHVERNLFLT